MQIVLYSDDIVILSYWNEVLAKDCVIIDELEDLFTFNNSLIIVNYFNEISSSILEKIILSNKVLILHRTPNILTAKKLLNMGVHGYGNSLMKSHFILSAIETIKDDMVWLYPKFTSMLINEIPNKENTYEESILDILTKREKEVALLLKNAYTYKDIAIELKITPSTVKAHASKVYSKLIVKDRLSLALLLK